MIGGYIQFYGVDLPNNTWMWYDNSSFDYNNFWKYQNYGEYTAQFTMSATEHDPGIWEFGTKSDQLPFVCYITQPPLSPPSNQQCPQGSSYLSTLSRCLMPVTTGASFDGAEKNCASVGGHLPAVFSAFQNNALCDFIASHMPNITVDRTFLGLDNYNGTWLFTDGNQPMSYSNWETPNEVNQTEAYAYIEMNTRKWVSMSKIIDLVIPMPYVPKTGSTTLTNAIAYDLYKTNDFNVLHLNMTKNRQIMSLPDQYKFISNITNWNDRLPAFYHGHVAFIDFQRFGQPSPIYVNLVREPLERLLSHYYFLRYGDTYRVGLKRSRAGNNETFDDCVARQGKDCDMKQMWMQIPYFCGQHHFCSEIGSQLALEQAKRNLLENYLLVGVTERMRDFIGLLEHLVPRFFKGALNHFDKLDEKRSHLRYTIKKIPPNDQTLSVIKRNKIYEMEKEFYDFALAEFDAALKKATNNTDQVENISLLKLQYHFEKIKP
ncbi:hypothetical protein WR25_20025 [Diploscapter pachys]|uniref:C-type lectin domain-containing protein n=1 Tax=Diploscapter pachys TaxID=2018661 RepID=A0A2A2JUD0_9BILA|nr:hypothetical protein WR25_20025 [Diploscapter pachys]